MGAHWETSQKGLAQEYVCGELPQLCSQGASARLGCVAGSALLESVVRCGLHCGYSGDLGIDPVLEG